MRTLASTTGWSRRRSWMSRDGVDRRASRIVRLVVAALRVGRSRTEHVLVEEAVDGVGDGGVLLRGAAGSLRGVAGVLHPVLLPQRQPPGRPPVPRCLRAASAASDSAQPAGDPAVPPSWACLRSCSSCSRRASSVCRRSRKRARIDVAALRVGRRGQGDVLAQQLVVDIGLPTGRERSAQVADHAAGRAARPARRRRCAASALRRRSPPAPCTAGCPRDGDGGVGGDAHGQAKLGQPRRGSAASPRPGRTGRCAIAVVPRRPGRGFPA